MAGLLNSLKSVASKVQDAFSRHSGASDVILVASKNGAAVHSSTWNVHTSPIRGKEAQARLSIHGAETEMAMHVLKDEMRCCFGIADCVRPVDDQLQRLLPVLKRGRNLAVFVVVELNPQTMRWDEKERIPFSIFLWDFDDVVVCLDFEEVVVRTDVLAKGEEVIKQVKGTAAEPHRGADCSSAREGVGAVLSCLHRAGYQCMILTQAPITRAEKIRQTLHDISRNEVSKWGNSAALPPMPVITTSTHTARAIVDKLADKVAMSAKRASFKTSAISEVASLFEPPAKQPQKKEGTGGIYGGFCAGSGDAQSYVDGGVPSRKLFIVDKAGRTSMHEGSGRGDQSWAEFGELPLKEVFPQRSLQVNDLNLGPSSGFMLC